MPIQGLVRYEPITVGNSAIGMTTTVGNPAYLPQAAEILVEDQAIRYRIDGSVPTATVGIGVEVGGVITLINRGEVTGFRAIRRDGVDATIQVTQGIDYVP